MMNPSFFGVDMNNPYAKLIVWSLDTIHNLVLNQFQILAES